MVTRGRRDHEARPSWSTPCSLRSGGRCPRCLKTLSAAPRRGLEQGRLCLPAATAGVLHERRPGPDETTTNAPVATSSTTTTDPVPPRRPRRWHLQPPRRRRPRQRPPRPRRSRPGVSPWLVKCTRMAAIPPALDRIHDAHRHQGGTTGERVVVVHAFQWGHAVVHDHEFGTCV